MAAEVKIANRLCEELGTRSAHRVVYGDPLLDLVRSRGTRFRPCGRGTMAEDLAIHMCAGRDAWKAYELVRTPVIEAGDGGDAMNCR